MVDDIKIGNDWFHALKACRTKTKASDVAQKYRERGYKARVKKIRNMSYVFVSERKK